MIATVTYPYRDRETLEIRRAGDEVELSAERFAELSAGGYVEAFDEPKGEEPEETEREEGEPKGEEPAETELTAAQMRAEIEARGGFAPKKATKAQLAELLGQL